MNLDTLRAALDQACALVTALEAIPTDSEDLDRADQHAEAAAAILKSLLAEAEAARMHENRRACLAGLERHFSQPKP